ncbi:hypothetical protein GCM10009740_18480 [Terrabacter terrae]|uniref:Transcriptional regulator, AbiEi antitoxin, Type IV TA system n=1 Tax=Terrabacter terrae TaxID=318434 RepID=A0ABP5FLD9_9MICO
MHLSLITHDDVFPLSRALSVGIDRAELRRLAKQGRVHRLHHGWFAVRAPADEADRHRLRLAALLQQYATGAVASDASALLLLGLPTYEPDWSVAHLMRTRPTASGRVKAHRKADLVVRPALVHPEVTRLPPTGRAVHPAVAVALAGLTDPCAFLVPADAALRDGHVTRDELQLAVEVIGRRPGIERVRAALPRCDARHESPGETVTAWVLHHLGFRTVPQFAVPGTEAFTRGGQGYRADLGIVGSRVLVEFDGRSKYASAQDLWDEKRREDRIRALGWEVVRLTWADLSQPERVRALVEAAMRRAAALRRAG